MTRARFGWPLIGAFIVVAMLLLHTSALSARVSGASMSPYAEDGATLLVNTAVEAGRGDVVIVDVPAGWASEASARIIKRVVGVGGDRISCCDRDTGSLVLNGELLREPYVAGSPASSVGFDVRVPDGHVWLLGDNRATSIDSRRQLSDATAGAVPRSSIVGVVWARFPAW